MRSKITVILSSIIIAVGILTLAIASGEYIRYDQPTTVEYRTLSKTVQSQIDCLAENMMFEAGFEPKEGQVAVAMVTINRVASGNYSNNICGVVKQKVRQTCQFSWVCEKKNAAKRLTMLNTPLYNEIRDLAVHVFFNHDRMQDVTNGATYYHADYVNPRWGLPQTKKIGRHIFYKNEKDLQNMNREIKLWKM